MPLVRKDDDVYIEYTMPKEIKALITDDFLKEFRNQLFRINEHYGLDTFAEYGIPTNPSNSGWFAALGKACLLTNKEELFNYWRTLPWYDSDIFDGELAEMLIERHFILGDLSKVIEEQLGIKDDELVICNECGKWFTKDMVIEAKEEDEYYCWDIYRCLHCQDVINSKDRNKHATDYYREVLKELEEYKKNNPIEIKED